MKFPRIILLCALILSVLIGFSPVNAEESRSYLVLRSETTNDFSIERVYQVYDEKTENFEQIVEILYNNGDSIYKVFSEDGVNIYTVENLNNVLYEYKENILAAVTDLYEKNILTNSVKFQKKAGISLQGVEGDWVYSDWFTSTYNTKFAVDSIAAVASMIASLCGIPLANGVIAMARAIVNNSIQNVYFKKRYRIRIKIGGIDIQNVGTLSSYKYSNFTGLISSHDYMEIVNQ